LNIETSSFCIPEQSDRQRKPKQFWSVTPAFIINLILPSLRIYLVAGDLTEAFKGVQQLARNRNFTTYIYGLAWSDINAVIHVALPFTGTVQDAKKDMLDPAIEGTLNVVRSAHKVGIKRIIITSSFVAVCDVALGGSV